MFPPQQMFPEKCQETRHGNHGTNSGNLTDIYEENNVNINVSFFPLHFPGFSHLSPHVF